MRKRGLYRAIRPGKPNQDMNVTDQLAAEMREAIHELNNWDGTSDEMERIKDNMRVVLAAYDAQRAPAPAAVGKHAPEPWRVEVIELHEGGQGIAVTSGNSCREHIASNQTYYPAAITEANARRIVACVNVLAGIPTDHLELLRPGDGIAEALRPLLYGH